MSKIIDYLIAYRGSLTGDKGRLSKNNDFTHVNFESPYAFFLLYFLHVFL